MRFSFGDLGFVVIVALAGCDDAVLKETPVAALPPQPPVAGTADAPSAVVISLPPDIYKRTPSKGEDTHVTEAQLEFIEDYGLHLDSDDRELLESRVNDCRFTARESCTIQAAEAPPA